MCSVSILAKPCSKKARAFCDLVLICIPPFCSPYRPTLQVSSRVATKARLQAEKIEVVGRERINTPSSEDTTPETICGRVLDGFVLVAGRGQYATDAVIRSASLFR